MTPCPRLAICSFITLLDVTAAAAQSEGVTKSQTPPMPVSKPAELRRWEVELHVGGSLTSHPTDGIATLPGPGSAFVTFGGTPSRRVSSWFFGDGAALLNQATAMWPLATNRAGIVPLDAVLNSASVRREPGASFGLRVSRQLGSRIAAEFSVNFDAGSLALTNRAIAGIEASRASAVPTLRDLAFFGRSMVVSTANARARGGSSVVGTGAINIFFPNRRRTTPFVVVGGGMVSHVGTTPTVSVTTEHSIDNGVPFPFPFEVPVVTLIETDRVGIRFVPGRHRPTFVAGGGVRYALSSRWTWRVDVRRQLTPNRLKILLDAGPQSAIAPAGSGSFAGATNTNPSIQFGHVAFGNFAAPASLSGSAIRDFVTFEGSGIQRQLTVTSGLAWRF